jgi:hypothetical protein
MSSNKSIDNFAVIWIRLSGVSIDIRCKSKISGVVNNKD